MLDILLQHFGTPIISLPDACKYLKMDRRSVLKDKDFPLYIVRHKGKDCYYVKLSKLAKWLEK